MSLIDPRMLTQLHNFYRSTVTIEEKRVRRGVHGEELVDWEQKAGHVDLPCRIGPSGGREVKLADQTYAVSTHTIGLRGNYPLVTVEDRAVDDGGLIYEILAVESDDQEASTYLYTEIVS